MTTITTQMELQGNPTLTVHATKEVDVKTYVDIIGQYGDVDEFFKQTMGNLQTQHSPDAFPISWVKARFPSNRNPNRLGNYQIMLFGENYTDQLFENLDDLLKYESQVADVQCMSSLDATNLFNFSRALHQFAKQSGQE